MTSTPTFHRPWIQLRPHLSQWYQGGTRFMANAMNMLSLLVFMAYNVYIFPHLVQHINNDLSSFAKKTNLSKQINTCTHLRRNTTTYWWFLVVPHRAVDVVGLPVNTTRIADESPLRSSPPKRSVCGTTVWADLHASCNNESNIDHCWLGLHPP